MADVTELMERAEGGDTSAAAQLLELVYDDLRKLAAARLRQERAGQTLEATALVHEVYLRLLGPAGEPRRWEGRRHFFGAAAEAMRRILIERARRKQSVRHGGGCRRVELDAVATLEERETDVDLMVLDEALGGLAREAPGKAELVRLRYFAGLTLREAAAVLGISLATAERHWAYARSWLYCALGDAEEKSAAAKNNSSA
jgi:RNA polymerase sigma factor (TIGR02999 family)